MSKCTSTIPFCEAPPLVMFFLFSFLRFLVVFSFFFLHVGTVLSCSSLLFFKKKLQKKLKKNPNKKSGESVGGKNLIDYQL